MPNGYTEAALDYALATLAQAAAPWRLPKDVAAQTRAELTTDFGREITDEASWSKWREIIRRQGRTVGALAAFLADVEAGKGERLPTPGDLRLVHVAAAVTLAKAVCRAPSEFVSKGPLCNGSFKSYQPGGLEGEALIAAALRPVTG